MGRKQKEVEKSCGSRQWQFDKERKAACANKIRKGINSALPNGMKTFSHFLGSRSSACIIGALRRGDIHNHGYLCGYPLFFMLSLCFYCWISHHTAYHFVPAAPAISLWTLQQPPIEYGQGREEQSGKQRQSLDAVQVLFSISQSFGVVLTLHWPQIQNSTLRAAMKKVNCIPASPSTLGKGLLNTVVSN